MASQPSDSQSQNSRATPADSAVVSLDSGEELLSKAIKPLRFDSLMQGAYLQLWRTYDRMKTIEEDLFSQFDLSAQQYNTLRLLQHVYPNGMATLQIADRLISRAPDITRLIDRLVERGLVRRNRKADNRRVVEVILTEDGLKLLEALKMPVERCHEEQLGHLSEDQLHELIRLLKLAGDPHEDPNSRWTANSSRP